MEFHKEMQEQAQSNSSSDPLTHTLIPPARQFFTTFPSWLYSAILGNGHLLVCLDEFGSIVQFFYPFIDAGPHLRSFLLGVQVQEVVPESISTFHPSISNQAVQGNEVPTATGVKQGISTSWLANREWTHELYYIEGSAIVRCISINLNIGVQVEQIMAVHPYSDVLLIDVKISNLKNTSIVCKLVTYAGLDIDYRRSGNTCFYDVRTSSLMFFSFDRYITITCDAPVSGFACNEASSGELDYTFQNASEGLFSGSEYANGHVTGAVSHDFGKIEAGETSTHFMRVGFSRSIEEATQLSSTIETTKQGVAETTTWWQGQNVSAQFSTSSAAVRNLYDRSLITLRLLMDSSTGGIIAAPEFDPDFRSCGGYGACWPRDGAFIAHALDTSGQYDTARAFYEWALKVQSKSGVWYQRYYVTGQLAPTWGLVQFDETGIVVWSICRHIQLTGNIAYGQKVFPQLVLACEYMQNNLDPETGLAPTTMDIWEEREGISTYACASTWGGFDELARLSLKLGKISEAKRWAAAAAQLKASIEEHLWDAAYRRFLRGLKTRISPHDIEKLRRKPGFSESDIIEIDFAGKPRYFQQRDAIIDASILGLSIPFNVFSSDDPRMIATTDAITAHLTSPIGGIRRYQDDSYRGGNPWVICSLWLALQDIAAGRPEQALNLYNWVVEHRTSLDLLPEQVDRTTGQPCWVIPLGWSHAMFILVSQALTERKLLY